MTCKMQTISKLDRFGPVEHQTSWVSGSLLYLAYIPQPPAPYSETLSKKEAKLTTLCCRNPTSFGRSVKTFKINLGVNFIQRHTFYDYIGGLEYQKLSDFRWSTIVGIWNSIWIWNGKLAYNHRI